MNAKQKELLGRVKVEDLDDPIIADGVAMMMDALNN
jgi:hypothetical protein